MTHMGTTICLEETALGIELGSTRIKAVLIDPAGRVLAAGDHAWHDRLEDGYWTYSLAEVWAGLQSAWAALAADVREKYGLPLTRTGCLGISAMMHGYIPFDSTGRQLAAFRTWRNTTTAPAAAELTRLLHFNIPQRWTAAHLYQAVLNGEAHVREIDFLTTLAGYVHWQLTGQKVVGVGEASGIFPIDSETGNYDTARMKQMDGLLQAHGIAYGLADILPAVLQAGADAGSLTGSGAHLLDPTGTLQAGIPLCPPEGDAGTGMTATNAVAARTGNVSAGTSIFSMVVLEKPLSGVYPELDLVTTPTGAPVAMVHCNTCTSDLDAWIGMLAGAFAAAGAEMDNGRLYRIFFESALRGDSDCGGLININCFSGEPVTGLTDGRPLFVRRPGVPISFENFARVQIFSALATLKIGHALLDAEGVQIDRLLGHGGLFKTTDAGQRFLAAALQTPVSVMETAGEGGPWGMALLAAYRLQRQAGDTLEAWLQGRIFRDAACTTIAPDPADAAGFAAFLEDYKAALSVERAAVSALR